MIGILLHYVLPKKHTTKIAIFGSMLVFGFILTQNILFLGQKPFRVSWNWINIGDIHIPISLYADDFSHIFGLLAVFVYVLVVFFSVFYLKNEPYLRRYFVYLEAFILMMLGVIWADSLLLLYICWEGVGLFSYLLISFWYEKKEAIQSARQAFWVNRVADVCLLMGIFGLFLHTNSFQLTEIIAFFEKNPQNSLPNVFVYALVLGAFAKSAQFPLYVWLPNAMTAPTPISALLHASTMVTMGVYWLYRILPVLPAHSQYFLVWIGLFSAFLGAFGAIFQKDIKKMLAYSTMSQLGYMVCAIGLGFGAENAGILHLFTHAFFKAGLFLGAGVIIYALHELHLKNHDAQNMLQMGNLYKYLPYTCIFMLVFGGALVGLPFTSGFLSKENILMHSWFWAFSNQKNGFFFYVVPIGLHIVGLMTAFYVFRAFILVFFGNKDNFLENNIADIEKLSKIKKIDNYYFVKIPLFLLSLGSFGVVFWDFSKGEAWIFGVLGDNHKHPEILHGLHAYESLVMWVSLFGITLMGTLVYFSYKKKWFYTFQETRYFNIEVLSTKLWQLFLVSFRNICEKIFIFDKKYIDKFFVQSAKIYVVFSHLIAGFDKYVVDGFVNFGVFLVRYLGNFFVTFQKGNASNYVFWLVVFLIMIFFVGFKF